MFSKDFRYVQDQALQLYITVVLLHQLELKKCHSKEEKS